jgi:urea transporter
MEPLLKNTIPPFIEVILKGYGQTLICPNCITGVFVLLAIFFISPQTCLLTFIGASFSTLTARLIGARPLHIHSGCYGFNGIVLGIAWPWFIKLNATSIMILVLFSAISSVLLKYLIDQSSRTRFHLPIFSIPSVILIWLIFILLLFVPSWELLKGPDQRIIEYVRDYQCHVLRLDNKQWTNLTLNMYWDTFKIHLWIIILLTVGIFRHSRVSAAIAVTTVLLTIIMVHATGGISEFRYIDIYLYNTVPCGLALGGNFLVFNRKVCLMTLCTIVLIIGTVYIGLHILQFPIFVAAFNLFTIMSIWLVKNNILKKAHGFYAVPMELIFSPESAMNWQKGEIYAQNFWKEIERSWS